MSNVSGGSLLVCGHRAWVNPNQPNAAFCTMCKKWKRAK